MEPRKNALGPLKALLISEENNQFKDTPHQNGHASLSQCVVNNQKYPQSDKCSANSSYRSATLRLIGVFVQHFYSPHIQVLVDQL